MYIVVTCPPHFFSILLLIRDIAALIKSCVYVYFDSYYFLLIFYLKKGQKKRFVTELFHIKKINFVREFLISQGKNFHQIAPFQFS